MKRASAKTVSAKLLFMSDEYTAAVLERARLCTELEKRLGEIRSMIEVIEGQQHRDDRFVMSIPDARRLYRLTRPVKKPARKERKR